MLLQFANAVWRLPWNFPEFAKIGRKAARRPKLFTIDATVLGFETRFPILDTWLFSFAMDKRVGLPPTPNCAFRSAVTDGGSGGLES